MTGRTQAELRDAAGGLFAERVASLGGTDVGPPDVEITIALAEGGPAKRVVCGPVSGEWRRCVTPGVKAVFEVRSSLVERLLEPADAARSSEADGGASDASP